MGLPASKPLLESGPLASETDATSALWFVVRNDIMAGPYSSDELRKKVQEGFYVIGDFCWRHGFSEWRPLGSVLTLWPEEARDHLRAYPSLDVPAKLSERARVVSPVRRVRAAPQTQVNLAFRDRWRFIKQLSVREWAFAVVMSVAFAWIAVDTALKEVQERFNLGLELYTLGKTQEMGEAPEAIDPSFWDPLLSAPGITEVVPSEINPRGTPTPGALPVIIEGLAKPLGGLRYQVGSYTVLSTEELPLWSAERVKADPIYVKSVRIHGYLSKDNASLVKVKLPGGPGYHR